MKPIKLKMKAFGSFLNETTIDFTLLNKSGFYLITGPTGSGKTTIFDAIMFALYGEASGNIRNQDGLRNDLATDKESTYVEFTFEKDCKIYTVTRSPKYTVSYRQTPIEAKVSLKYDNTIVEKNGPVNSEILNIIGLNANQFRQVMMLAQGEFMKLIHAKSTERDEIFRKIFKTEIYEQIESLLKEENKELKQTIKTLEVKIQTLINTIPGDIKNELGEKVLKEISYLEVLISELKTKNKELLKCLKEEKNIQKEQNKLLLDIINEKHLSEAINNDFADLDIITKELKKLDLEKDTIKDLKEKITLLKKIDEIYPVYEQLSLLLDQYNDTKSHLNEVKTLFEEKQLELNFFIDQTNMIELDRLSLVNLKKTLNELNENLILKQNLIDINKNLSEYQKLYDSLKDTVDKYTDSIEIIDAGISKRMELIKKEPDLIFECSEVQSELNLVNLEAKELKETQNIYTQYLEIMDVISSSAKEYQTMYQQYQEALTKFQNTEYSYFQNIAQILSKTLEENTPCPVCGSTHHPNIASCSDKLVTKEDVDKQSEEVDAARLLKDNTLLKLETFKKESNKLQNIIFERLDIASFDEYENKVFEVQDTIFKKTKELVNKLSGIEVDLSNVKKEKANIQVLENEKNTLKHNLDLANEQLLNVMKEHAKIMGEKTAIESKITIANNIDEIKEAIIDRQEAISLLEEAITSFDEEYKLVKTSYDELKGSLQSLIKQLALKNEEKERLEVIYNKLVCKINIENNILLELFKELKDLPKYIEKTSKYDSIYQTTKEQYDKLMKKVENKQIVDLSYYDKLIDELKNKISLIDEAIMKKQNSQSQIDKIYKELTIYYDDYQLLNKKALDLNELTQAASGQNEIYLSFERYVLIEYFENILQHANIRLSKMTSGRYILHRKIDKTKGRSQQGLDMDIFDFETGKRRDVTTLSGGETFKAALSLALGLSDTIESSVGGIQIDTLFIDEGFGTLDDESLNQAINILLEIQGNNKSIGIISHVQELKDIIPTKLIVSKDDKSSIIKIIS